MKLLKFLFDASKAGVIGVGIGFVSILVIMALSTMQGLDTGTKIDVGGLMRYGYFWIAIFVVYIVGQLTTAVLSAYKITKQKKEKGKSIPVVERR